VSSQPSASGESAASPLIEEPAATLVGLDRHRPVSPPWLRFAGHFRGEQGGGTKTRKHRSPDGELFALDGSRGCLLDGGSTQRSCCCQAASWAATTRRRTVPPVSSWRRCRSRAECPVGRERPPLGCPLLRPKPGPQGSLAPHVHVAVIRRDGAMPVTPANAASVSSAVRASFALTARASGTPRLRTVESNPLCSEVDKGRAENLLELCVRNGSAVQAGP
jgi:hypothetical protein